MLAAAGGIPSVKATLRGAVQDGSSYDLPSVSLAPAARRVAISEMTVGDRPVDAAIKDRCRVRYTHPVATMTQRRI